MADGSITIGGVQYDLTATKHVPDLPDPMLHGQRRIMWHHGWAGPQIGTWPSDVRAGLTTVCLGMCQSAGKGTGQLALPPGVTRQEVESLVANGVDVLAGIGGSGDGGIAVTNDVQVGQAVESVQEMRDALGITGICWDLEGGPGIGWSTGAIIDASRRLIAQHLQIGIWSGLWGGRLEAWGQVARALGSDLDHWQRGFYDFPEAGDGRLNGIVTGDLPKMRSYVAREDQLVASFMPRPNASYANASPLPVLVAAATAARAAHPLAGWSLWEDKIDAAQGWTATRALAAIR